MRLPTIQTVMGRKLVELILLLVGIWPSLVLAQVSTTITSTTGVGNFGTSIKTDGPKVEITGGTRPGNGMNLFHSFSQFNVGSGDTAQFLNTTPSLPTSNILSRVTGGSPSNIFGTIDTLSYPGANLFLMNPAGIVFGPNSTLNVSGSVAFTTADYLRLADNGSTTGIFHANARETSLLTSTPVVAFGFLGMNPEAIEVKGSKLALKSDQSISLVGGNITMESGTLVAGNQVYMAGVASPGEILTGTLASAANINGQSPGAFGNVQISQGSNIDTSDSGGGTIRIRGGHLVIAGSDIFAKTGDISFDANAIQITNFTHIATFTDTTTKAGNIRFEASKDIEIGSAVQIESLATIAPGDAGNITFRSGQGNINFTNGATVTSQAFDGGRDTGSIEIDAQHGDIHLDNSSRAFLAVSENTGKMGGIRISANNVDMRQKARIDIDNGSTHVAAAIEIFARGLLRLTGKSEIETTATGNKANVAANVILKAQEIRIEEGSKLSADTEVSSSGAGGNLIIQGLLGPADSVRIDGPGSGIFLGTQGVGPGGTIDLSTRLLLLHNGGVISAATSGVAPSATGGSITVTATDQLTLSSNASITASTSGPGNAGNILVKANDIAVSGGSNITASSTGPGNAGTVTIQGLQGPASSLLINGVNSGVFTKTNDTGAGGDIKISSNSVRMQDEGRISGETSGTAATATGGRVGVEGDRIRIESGALVTSSSAGAGSGGNITLAARESVTVLDGASVSASSTGTGAAGNIEIDAGKQLDVQRGSITTQSNELNGGNINIRAIDLLRVVDGKISTSALNGGGNGGTITIDPKVVLLQNSDILAQANRGTGGDISITTPVFIADQSSRVDASTPFGLNGRITIQSPTSNLSGTVGQLVSKTSPPQVLLQNRCVALAGGEQSTFILTGRDALPGEPIGWLSSPVSMEHWTGEETAHASQLMVRNRTFNSSPVIAAHSDKSRVLSLRRLTPPGFLVRTFATGATGCPS